MAKFYRCVKDNPLWVGGAIISDEGGNGYKPIEDIWWLVDGTHETEYLSRCYIENSPDWFERVYKSKLDKAAFVTKEAMVESYNKCFKK